MPSEVVYKPSEKLNPIFPGGTLAPPKFIPTYLEWLFKDAKYMSETSSGGVISTGTITLYTVPEDFELYVVSCFLECWGTAGDNRLTLETPDHEVEFLSVVSSVVGTTANISANYPYPIILPGKTVVRMVNHHARTTQYAMGITGFLIKKKNIPNF